MNFFHSLHIQLPRPLYVAAEYIINIDLKRIFKQADDLDLERLQKLIEETQRWSIKVDTTTIGFVVSTWVNSLMQKVYRQSDDIQIIEKVETVLKIVNPLSLPLDLWNAQNLYVSIGKSLYLSWRERAS